MPQQQVETNEVVRRIESVVQILLAALDRTEIPEIVVSGTHKRFNNVASCRSFTSMLLVLAYCHNLLRQPEFTTTTIREVYYYYVTHFRNQRECDAAISDCCKLLEVPRHALRLQAASRGWFAGNLRLVDGNQVLFDGRNRSTGCPVSPDWVLPHHQRFSIQGDAQCIVVVEKDGIYQRLVQDGFWEHHNCILITGKGFPDHATRAAVEDIRLTLDIPVFGIADCDPYGVHVLRTYQVPQMRWLGLRPSHTHELDLPAVVFQELTTLDESRLTKMQDAAPEGAQEELKAMEHSKVELEALHWLGMDFMSNFFGQLLGQDDLPVIS